MLFRTYENVECLEKAADSFCFFSSFIILSCYKSCRDDIDILLVMKKKRDSVVEALKTRLMKGKGQGLQRKR